MTKDAQGETQPQWLGLEGRICAVTGAAGGIGTEIALAFAQAGCAVALLELKTASCDGVLRQIEDTGGRAVAIACDVSDPASVAGAADECKTKLGPCDILVNNAAILHAGSLSDIPVAKWNELLSVNLTGYLLCAQSFGRHMKERGKGSLIHVGSIAGHLPQAYSGAYSVSKAGVMMLSELLAVELGEYGIRSNVVSPAMVRTPLSEDFYKDPELLRRRTEMVPSRRIGAPRDIAEAILFLASDRASYINGREILVDGGLSRSFLGMIPRPGYDRADNR